MAGANAMRKWGLRAGGSALFLAALFWFLPREAIVEGFQKITLGLYAGVLAAFLAGHVANAAKWWLLLDCGLPFLHALRAHFAGLAANLCLPGAAGGDAVRAALAHVAMRDGPKLAAGAVADRLIDMIGMIALSLTGLMLLREGATGFGVAAEIAVVLILGLAGTVYGFPRLVRLLWTRLPRLPARGLALRTADAFATLGRRPLLLVGTLAMSLAIQSLFIWLSARLGLAVGVDIPLAAWFFAWPLAKLVAVLPISLNGLGVRESSLAALLVPFGAGAAQVVASGLVWQAVMFGAGALGALVLAVSGTGWRAAKPVTE
ncbi:MAG: YbhN family protein [Paracoccaceae bacterium]